MSRRAELTAGGQLALFADKPSPRGRYRHQHTADELAAFERTLATLYAIRPDWLASDERLCPGCGKVIRGQARHCGAAGHGEPEHATPPRCSETLVRTRSSSP
jgi:hypothetical protein